MRYCFFPTILLVVCLMISPLHAQDEQNSSTYTNKQLREKSAYRQATGLGDFTIGSHGIVKDEREQSKTGDIEVGRIFEFKQNQIIPRVLELETFFVSKVGSYEDSVYENLGVGAGSKLSYRKTGQADKWFLRFTAIVPTEYYRERYGTAEAGEDSTIFELTLGRDFAIAPVPNPTRLHQRLATYALTASVPATALQNTAWNDANAVAFLNNYLDAHYTQLKQIDIFTYADMTTLHFILHRANVKLNEREARLMYLHDNERDIQPAWEPVFRTLFTRALTILFRDKCTLIFHVTNASALQTFTALPDGEIHPDQAIDLDRMIETFLNAQWLSFQRNTSKGTPLAGRRSMPLPLENDCSLLCTCCCAQQCCVVLPAVASHWPCGAFPICWRVNLRSAGDVLFVLREASLR